MLFPISLVPYERITDWHAFDADTGKDSAREIREYYIPDFSNWKDRDSYAAAFQRLLRVLNSEGKDGRFLGVLQSENPKTTFWNGKLKTISGTVSRRWWRLRTRFAHVATILIGERDRAMCLLLLPDQLMNSFILAALPVN